MDDDAPPPLCTPVYDTVLRRTGVFWGVLGTLWCLRPPGGGIEWTAAPHECQPLQPATAASLLKQHRQRATRAAARHRPDAQPSRSVDHLFHREPDPVPGCTRCDQLAHRRRELRASGDLSGVTDCNVLIRRHAEHADTPAADTP